MGAADRSSVDIQPISDGTAGKTPVPGSDAGARGFFSYCLNIFAGGGRI